MFKKYSTLIVFFVISSMQLNGANLSVVEPRLNNAQDRHTINLHNQYQSIQEGLLQHPNDKELSIEKRLVERRIIIHTTLGRMVGMPNEQALQAVKILLADQQPIPPMNELPIVVVPTAILLRQDLRALAQKQRFIESELATNPGNEALHKKDNE
jgi:hypothetical protein